jgi:hypothetical protein
VAKEGCHWWVRLVEFITQIPQPGPEIFQCFTGGADVADGDSQDGAVVEDGVGDVGAAFGVDGVEESHIGLVSTAQAEADDGEGDGGYDFEAAVVLYPRGKFGGHGALVLDDGGEALAAKGAHDEPEFEGTETAAERDRVLHQIDHARIFEGAQVFGQDGEGTLQNFGTAG